MYVLFSHFRPHNGAPENCFFQMSSYACASRIVCLHNSWKDKDKFPGEHWKSKTYKLKRSIYVSSIIRCKNTSNQIKPQIGHIWWETHSGDHPRGRNTWALIKGWPQKVCFLSDLMTILLADISNLLLNRGSSIFILLNTLNPLISLGSLFISSPFEGGIIWEGGII